MICLVLRTMSMGVGDLVTVQLRKGLRKTVMVVPMWGELS